MVVKLKVPSNKELTDKVNEIIDSKQDTLTAGTDLEIIKGSSTHNLPEGYTEVEYIQANGDAGIITSVAGNINTNVTLIANCTQITYASQVIISDGYDGNGGTYFGQPSTKSTWGAGGSGSQITSLNVLIKTEFNISSTITNTFALNGTVAQGSTIQTFSRTSTVPVSSNYTNWSLFGSINKSNNTIAYPTYGKLYYAKFEQNNTVVAEYIPAIRNSDNAVGLYDIANNTFIARNLGTGTLIAGEKVAETATINFTNKSGYILSTQLQSALENYYTKSQTYTKTEINQLIADIPKFTVSVVQSLPQIGEAMTLYLVPKTGTNPDIYNEYVWIESTSSYELIGNTAVDLSDYYNKTETDTLLSTKQDTLVAGTDLEIIEGSGAILPQGYTEVEYIQSSGTQYINVPYKVNNKTKFYCRYMQTALNTGDANGVNIIFGTSSASDLSKANFGLSRICAGLYPINSVGWGDDTSGSSFSINGYDSLNTWYEAYYDLNKIYINNTLVGTSTTNTSTTWIAPYNLGLFAGMGQTASLFSICRISVAWAEEEGALALKLIPARREADGKLGMYDIVNNTFLTNAGTGVFTAGADVIYQNGTIINFTNESGYIKGINNSDVISALGYTPVNPSSLATVATTGSFDDLTDKPYIPSGVVVDQTFNGTSANAQSGVAINDELQSNYVPIYSEDNIEISSDDNLNLTGSTSVNINSNGDINISGATLSLTGENFYLDNNELSFYSNSDNIFTVTSGGSTFYQKDNNNTFQVQTTPTGFYLSQDQSSTGIISVNSNGKLTIGNEVVATQSWVTNQGYTTNVGTVTSVNNVQPVNGNVTLNIPSAVTESTISGWGFTKNVGTVTSVNGVQPVNGNVTIAIPDVSNFVTNSSLATTLGDYVKSSAENTTQGTTATIGYLNGFAPTMQLNYGNYQMLCGCGEGAMLSMIDTTTNILTAISAIPAGIAIKQGQQLALLSLSNNNLLVNGSELATQTWVGQQGYITGITSSDVTTALGYTPYNSSNPNGYTSNVGTVTSVNNVQPVNGNVTLSIPSVGNGTVTFTQGGVTKGSITMNQSGNTTIDFDAGSSGGIQNTATGTNSLTILGTPTTFNYAMNIGLYSNVTEDDSIAIGQGARVSGADSLGIGRDCNVSGDNSIQLGYGTLIDDNIFQVWNYPLLDYPNGEIFEDRIPTTIARTSQIPSAVTESTISGWGFTKNVGTVTSVNGVQPVNGNVTIPTGGTVDQTYNSSSPNAQSGKAINGAKFVRNLASDWDNLNILGQTPTVSGTGNVNIGESSLVNGSYSIALGYNATVGYDENVNYSFAVAIGNYARCKADNTIQLGGGRNETANTLQIGNYTLLNTSTGLIPDARISTNIARTNQIPDVSNFVTNSSLATTLSDYAPLNDDVEFNSVDTQFITLGNELTYISSETDSESATGANNIVIVGSNISLGADNSINFSGTNFTFNNNELATQAWVGQQGFLTSSSIANMQTTGNLVTSISSSSTDSQYPSAKCVYDIIGDIETLLQAV